MSDVQIPERFRDEIRRAAAYRVYAACRDMVSLYTGDEDEEAYLELRSQGKVIAERLAAMDAVEAEPAGIPAEAYRSLVGAAAERAAAAVATAVEEGGSPGHIAEMAELSRDLHDAEAKVPAHA